MGLKISINNSGYMTTHKNQNFKIHISHCYVKTLLVIQGQVAGKIKKNMTFDFAKTQFKIGYIPLKLKF